MSSSDISLVTDGVTVVNAALLNSYRAAIAAVESGVMPLNNTSLTGTPTAPTAAPGSNTPQVASAAFVQQELAGLTASDITGFDTAVRSSRLDQMAAPTASISMNNQKLTGMASGAAATDGATLAQVQAGHYTGSGGAINAYTANSLSQALLSNYSGAIVSVKIGISTNDGASTLAVSGLAALPVKRRDGSNVQAGDLVMDSVYTFVCDGTSWIAQSPLA